MHSPAYGLGWIILRKHHVGLIVVAVYLALLAIARLMPAAYAAELKIGLMSIFGFLMIYLMGVFVNSETDLISTRSGYAFHLFTLPVRTRILILWQMAYGIVAVALFWIAFALLLLVPAAGEAAVWWPASLMSALVACLQALSWYPVPLPYLRALLAFVILAALSIFGVLGWANGLSARLLIVTYSIVIVGAILVAVHGVALTREGGSRERSWLPQTKGTASLLPGLTSPMQAQFWLEWRRNGLLLPVMVLVICVGSALLFALIGSSTYAPLGSSSIQIPDTARLWLMCVLWTPMIAMIGCCTSKADTYRPDMSLQPFLATRPLSSLAIVQVKMRMAARSTLSAWAILSLFLLGWLLLPAHDGVTTGSIVGLLMHHMSFKSSLGVILSLTAMVVWTWKCQVSGLWVEFTGRLWFFYFYGFGVMGSLWLVVVWSLFKAVKDPVFASQLVPILPYLAFGLALLKGLTAIGALLSLRGNNLATARTIARFVCVWLLIYSALCGLLYWLLPSGLASPGQIALGAFLYLPLARLLLAPLALHRNRHR